MLKLSNGTGQVLEKIRIARRLTSLCCCKSDQYLIISVGIMSFSSWSSGVVG